MRPQHDGHDGRPSPQSHPEASPFVPRARSGETSFIGRIRQDRPDGKSGRHRLDASATQRAARAQASMPAPKALEPSALPSAESLPSAGSPPAAVSAPTAGEIAPAWHDLVDPAEASQTASRAVTGGAANLPAVPDRTGMPALTPERLPAPPQELSLARRDSVVPRQATAQDPWVFSAWGKPPTYNAAEVWDSTEEHTFAAGYEAVRPADGYVAVDDYAPAILRAPALDKTALADQVASLDERYLTPAGPLTPGLAPVRKLRGAKVARYAALGIIALLGIAAAVSLPHGSSADSDLTNSSQSILDDRSNAAANRSLDRAASPSASATAAPTASASPKPSPTKPAVAALPAVSGFDKAQVTNARTIVQTGQKLGMPARGLLVGLMTAMQESNLYNQASQAVPESFNYPHQGDSVDYDSCGLFQQRTSMGWGTVKQIMNPVYSSTKFFQRLKQVSGWQNMELTLAAQAVQGSAFPYAYAKHESGARRLLAALT
jgi:hypothetical protein